MDMIRSFAGGIAALGVCDALLDRARAQTPIANGVELNASYTFDVLSNVRGGARQGVRYLDNADIVLDIDPAAFSSLQNSNVHISVLYNNGAPFSDALVGDLQVVSNIEAPARAIRLYEAWIEQGFANDNISVLAGLYDLNSEFDALDSASLFLNSAHGIGADIGQTGQNGPSIFPVAGLAFRVQADLSEQITARGAIIEGTPGNPDHPKRTAVKFANDEGALLIGEMQHVTERSKILYGIWGYTTDFEPLDPVKPSQSGNFGAYVRGERTLVNRDGRHVSGFARAGWASPKFNPIEYFFSAGLHIVAPFENRPYDSAGIAISWGQTGRPYRDSLNTGGDQSTDQEVGIELTYQVSLSNNIFIQPDIQYIISPASRSDVRDALVLGVRVSAAL